MAHETTTAAAGPDNPQEKRTCSKCNAEKVVSPATWPHRKGREGHYQAHGLRCLDCEKKRKAEYEKRRDDIAQMIAKPPEAPATGKPEDKRKALTAASKLDVAQALKAGSLVMNQVAPAVLSRLLEYMEDPDSEHHQWALELLAQRILPRKLYEELGGQAAGAGSLVDKRPTYVLNVSVASPGAPGATYENEVPLLSLAPEPAAQEESDPSTAG